MLKKETLDKIASLLKLDGKKLSEAIADANEVDIVIDDKIQVFDEASIAARDRSKYNEGKKAGEEMPGKTLKKMFELQLEENDLEKVANALIEKTKKEAGGSASEKEKALEDKIKQWQQKANEAEDKYTKAEQKAAEAALDRELLASFPKNRDSKLSDDEYLFLVKKTLQIEQTADGKRIVKKDGKALEDAKTLEPISIKEAIEGHFNERKWVSDGDGGAGGGAGDRKGPGGGNSNPAGGGSKFTKMSEVKKHLEDQGISMQGEKGQAFIQAAVKENPQIDLNS